MHQKRGADTLLNQSTDSAKRPLQTAKLTQQPKAVYQNGAQSYEATSPICVASAARQGIPLKAEVIVGSYSSLSSGLSSSDDESDY